MRKNPELSYSEIVQESTKQNMTSTHEAEVRVVLSHLQHLKSRKKKVVYIGSSGLDLQLLLRPAKEYWDGLHQWGLLEVWAEHDRRLCAEYGIPFFDTMELVRQCPGVRCDGMHFASDFAAVGCRTSSHLWDCMLIDFLKGHLLPEKRGERRQNGGCG